MGLPEIYVYAFYFDDVTKAKKVELAYSTWNAPAAKALTVCRDENVILILRGGAPTERDRLRLEMFGP